MGDDVRDDASGAGGRLRGGGRPAKRLAIENAARVVFGRDGYSRSSIDAIATEAGVSTRTIYNHFDGKEQLFASVLEASATEVASSFVAKVARGLGRRPGAADDPDLAGRLAVLGRASAEQRTDFPEHFAMVRQINAEAPHFPPAVLEAWQQAGPERVQREVARHLLELADAGRLRVADGARAARHFTVVVLAEVSGRSYVGAPPLSAAETERMIADGIEAFLHGYAADEASGGSPAPAVPRPGLSRARRSG